MLEDSGLSELESTVHGEVLRPGGQDYELGRRVFKAMIDWRPEAIVRGASAHDVTAALNKWRSPNRCVAIHVPSERHSVRAFWDSGPARRSPRVRPHRATLKEDFVVLSDVS